MGSSAHPEIGIRRIWEEDEPKEIKQADANKHSL